MYPTLDAAGTVQDLLDRIDRLATLDPSAAQADMVEAFRNCATALARAGDTTGAALFRAHAALLAKTKTASTSLVRQAPNVARDLAKNRLPSLFFLLH